MKANTSRALRTAFDARAKAYDEVRPRFDEAVVADLLARTALGPGDEVLEIGAGTGQLTAGLLQAGLVVTALEPGPNMAEHLRRQFANRLDLQVVQSTFEDFDAESGRFAGVVSANAFHWVDPTVGYPKVASSLSEDGALGLIWSFAFPADSELQERLNRDVFVDDLADFRVGADQFLPSLVELLAGGRSELVESRLFEEPSWEMRQETLVWTIDRYVEYLASLANGVAIAEELGRRIRVALAGSDSLAVAHHVYISGARRR